MKVGCSPELLVLGRGAIVTLTPPRPPVPGRPRALRAEPVLRLPEPGAGGIICLAAPSVPQTAIIMFNLRRKRPLQRSNLFAD